MKLTFLSASDGTPLTKSFTKLDDGTYEKQSYPNVANFTSEDFDINSIQDFYDVLAEQAKHPARCLLKGNVAKPLVSESRAGSTRADEPTKWLCLDVDGIPVEGPDEFLELIGIKNVSYIEKLSCSAGIDLKRGYSAHIYIMLDQAQTPAMTKTWLKYLNLMYLDKYITLNRGGTALKWPLDITTCQNDKLLFTAEPICTNFDAPDFNRVTLSMKRARRLTRQAAGFDPAELDLRQKVRVNMLETALISELRAAGNYPVKSFKLDNHGILQNPDKLDFGDISIASQGRGYIYFNIKGGDSAAYYTYADNPTVVYNFKGEPPFSLKKACPELYDVLSEMAPEAEAKPVEPNEQGMVYEVGLDRATENFLLITYNKDTDHLVVEGAKRTKTAMDFLAEHGQPKRDFFPRWSVETNFDLKAPQIDFEKRQINRYRPSSYLLNAVPSEECPPSIRKLISHALGYDEVITEHFLNWVAVILQYRSLTLTAWVLGGTQGTGKGLVFDKILTPIFGPDQAVKATLGRFEQQFNAFLLGTQLLFVDEVQISELKNKKSTAMSNIKEVIGSSTLSIRAMHQEPRMEPNYCNLIFATNQFDAIEVDFDDRRFNIAPRQDVALKEVMDIDTLDVVIAAELQAFANYLLGRAASLSDARKILQTDERKRLIETTESLTKGVSHRIMQGDFDWFVEQYEALGGRERTLDFELETKIKNGPTFYETLAHMYEQKGGECRVTRDQLAVLFFYTTDIAKPTAHSFTKFLGYQGISLKDMRINGSKTQKGYAIKKLIVNDEQKWLKVESPEEGKLKAVN